MTTCVHHWTAKAWRVLIVLMVLDTQLCPQSLGVQIAPTLGMECPSTFSWSLFPLQYSTSLSYSFKSVWHHLQWWPMFFYSHIVVTSLLYKPLLMHFETGYISNFLSILITFYGFWNLDFFRYILPPFCVSPKLQRIHIVTLYYISAFYPLCLIGITWFFVKLHTCDIKPITWLWSKLKKCLSKFTSIKFNGKYSLVDVFATFFLLSYAKLLFTTFSILAYGITYNLSNGTLESTFHVQVDPSIAFFSNEHLPFVIISIAIFLVAVIPLTLLLALYPVRCF